MEPVAFDGIKSKKIRVDQATLQGHTRSMFEPHWARYLTQEDEDAETTGNAPRLTPGAAAAEVLERREAVAEAR